ncbi:MAG: 3-isopropylmalate dehydratase small subunit [Nitriliruptoraceae bacterium]|nr:3-isopropylmalate dehydratase small subunit [Nitriliruptoraceae bacterium]
MKAFTTVTSHVCPIMIDDADTDLIIPKQFLKRVTKTGFGPFAFSERRYLDDGSPDPAFPMNKPEHAGAEVLLTGRNFGCGSSREHAPWALDDAGFRVVIASSFADIFRTNCGKIGLLCVELDVAVVRQLEALVAADPAVQVTVDLAQQLVSAPAVGALEGVEAPFDVDQHTKHCLINGLDDIALTLEHVDAIDAFEGTRPSFTPLVPTP